MVKKAEKQRMSQVVTARLEDSRRYDIKESDEGHILVAQRADLVENPSEIYVVLHNRKMTLSEYRRLLGQNRANDRHTGNVFYKDGKMFKVHLGWRSHFKGDARSLKEYTTQEKNDMVHLRGLEKAVLDSQTGSNMLIYFQPQTNQLAEGIRGYDMREVILDYSHLPRDHPARGHGGPSIDYKIAAEKFYLEQGGVVLTSAGNRMATLTPQNSQ
jgi:hypothetical protein